MYIAGIQLNTAYAKEYVSTPYKKKGEDMKINSIEDDLQYIVDMYWHTERIHWEELDNPDDHIFHKINNLKNYLIGRKDD